MSDDVNVHADPPESLSLTLWVWQAAPIHPSAKCPHSGHGYAQSVRTGDMGEIAGIGDAADFGKAKWIRTFAAARGSSASTKIRQNFSTENSQAVAFLTAPCSVVGICFQQELRCHGIV